MNVIKIKKPDDWHLHLRDGETLKAVLPESERHFARALIMPNLTPPITSTSQATKYKATIISALQDKKGFTPLMTLYLTEATKLTDIKYGFETGRECVYQRPEQNTQKGFIKIHLNMDNLPFKGLPAHIYIYIYIYIYI